MMMYLVIATVIGIVMAIIGGALLSAAEFKEFLKPLAYTFLTIGFIIIGVLALVWLVKLSN